MERKTKQSALDRAAQIGVSIPTLNSWKRCGVDIYDDEQVRKRIAKMRNLPPELKPDWLPQTVAPTTEPIDGSIDGLVAELHACTDKHQAQTIKTKIDGLINAYKLRAAAGEYISREDHREIITRLAVTFKAAVTVMENELPPMLHGSEMAVMQRTIREKGDEILRSLEDIYKGAHNDWRATA